MCFFSSSHSGIFLSRVFSSSAFIKSAITGQRVTPENRFATPKRAGVFATIVLTEAQRSGGSRRTVSRRVSEILRRRFTSFRSAQNDSYMPRIFLRFFAESKTSTAQARACFDSLVHTRHA